MSCYREEFTFECLGFKKIAILIFVPSELPYYDCKCAEFSVSQLSLLFPYRYRERVQFWVINICNHVEMLNSGNSKDLKPTLVWFQLIGIRLHDYFDVDTNYIATLSVFASGVRYFYFVLCQLVINVRLVVFHALVSFYMLFHK